MAQETMGDVVAQLGRAIHALNPALMPVLMDTSESAKLNSDYERVTLLFSKLRHLSRPAPSEASGDVVEAAEDWQANPLAAHAIEDTKVEKALAAQRERAGGWTGLAAELFTLHRAAYPAPWCWEQCGDKCDDPVIGAAWWDDDEDCTPIAGELVPPESNVDREAYREPIALEMQSHADGSANANARLIVWLRNHVTEILNALATPAPQADALRELLIEARDALETFGKQETLEQLYEDDDEWAKFRFLVKDYKRAGQALSRIDAHLTESQTDAD